MFSELPVVAFAFGVEIIKGKYKSSSDADTKFMEVSGINMKIDVEEVEEGGRNNYVHRLPKPVKYGNIKLKRGFAKKSSEFASWCMDFMKQDFSKAIERCDVKVNLMSPTPTLIGSGILTSWTFYNAYPVNWDIGGFNSMSNELAFETIELAFQSMEVEHEKSLFG